MKKITVRECYDKIEISDNGIINSITNYQADKLELYIKKNKLDADNIIFSRDTITFINYVGFIRIEDIEIEILPKISLSNNNEDDRKILLRMLLKSKILKIKYSEVSRLNLENMNLNDILGVLFAIKVKEEITKGIYKEYIYIEENLSILKGALNVKGQVKNMALHNQKVFCRYEEFSVDNKLNQIILRCINIVIKSGANRETKKILSHIKDYLSDVSCRDINKADIERYKFSRLNIRFEEILILAKLILCGNSSIGGKSDEKSYSLLFKMNDVFEGYIGNILKENINEDKVHIQHSKYKLLVNEKTDNQIFKLIPDIVIEKNNKFVSIIDIKWKKISGNYNRHSIKREDFYQMYAYLTRYHDVKNVILLYPHNSEIIDTDDYLESWYLDVDKEKKIRVYSISLDNEKDLILKLKNMI